MSNTTTPMTLDQLLAARATALNEGDWSGAKFLDAEIAAKCEKGGYTLDEYLHSCEDECEDAWLDRAYEDRFECEPDWQY